MIRNRLSDLMGERQIKISRLSVDTGIARSTLTPLYYNQSSMIKIESINKLCNYFQIDVKDFFESTLFDFKFNIDELGLNKKFFIKSNPGKPCTFNLNFSVLVEVIEKNKKQIIEMNLETVREESELNDELFFTYTSENGDGYWDHLKSQLTFEYYFPDHDSEKIFEEYYQQLSFGMVHIFQKQLIDFIKESLISIFKENDTNQHFDNPKLLYHDMLKETEYILRERKVRYYKGVMQNKED